MRCAFLMLVVAVCSTVGWAQEIVFHDDLETGDTSGWWAPARAEETGQVTCYDATGVVILCAGTGQDADLRPGVPWPNPRFVINGDGTVTDMLTGLVWLQSADCFGSIPWSQALTNANMLASGMCGLADGSVAGTWRLPSVNELQSLAYLEHGSPALPNTAGTGPWASGDPFVAVSLSSSYWSSTSGPSTPTRAQAVTFHWGWHKPVNKDQARYVWPVRRGEPQWAPARVGRTGQLTCYDQSGAVVSCTGTGQDGDLRPGMAWPDLRFVDNGDGTVTDMLTGLVWLRNANCFGPRMWVQGLDDASALASGRCGLADGSVAGDWRLPSLYDLRSLLFFEFSAPSLPNTAGTGPWAEGDPFTGVAVGDYLTSTSFAYDPEGFWSVNPYGGDFGFIVSQRHKTWDRGTVWPVRGVR